MQERGDFAHGRVLTRGETGTGVVTKAFKVQWKRGRGVILHVHRVSLRSAAARCVPPAAPTPGQSRGRGRYVAQMEPMEGGGAGQGDWSWGWDSCGNVGAEAAQ